MDAPNKRKSKKPKRVPICIKLPQDLIDELHDEAKVSGPNFTRVIERRLRARDALHAKIESVTHLLLEIRDLLTIKKRPRKKDGADTPI